MRAIGVIIRDVVLDEMVQVSLVEDEYVIQKVSATASDPAFCDSILPRDCRTNACGLHAKCKPSRKGSEAIKTFTQQFVAIAQAFRSLPSRLRRHKGAELLPAGIGLASSRDAEAKIRPSGVCP